MIKWEGYKIFRTVGPYFEGAPVLLSPRSAAVHVLLLVVSVWGEGGGDMRDLRTVGSYIFA